ncbi:DUF2997 domain-containing protein [Chitinophaga qingshengii]|uniref:DUF2997 domain-containing protein n=1 Tax=Chitinophaga qingshengii TaxID=1569794 RepID=A0ABR7TNC5_9BACT|nr:DUF2997 domain-containing protein [Chitinophaga qingshengii]MBC9931986.1 DUF2997 domain-containing protein [Chitinophaga qingshengii]
MSGRKLIISIDKEGNVTAEINGVKGPSCKDYTKLVEQLVEGNIIHETLTSEYYEQEVKTDDRSQLSNNL